MALETGFYQTLKPIEMPDPTEMQGRAMNLRQLAMQEQKMQGDMNRADETRKLVEVGTALEGLAKMPEQERAGAWRQVKMGLLRKGVIRAEDSPDEYDPGYFGQTLLAWRQSQPGQEFRLGEAKIANLYADAARQRADAAKKGLGLTPGQEKADETFAKEATEYYQLGGKAAVEKNLGRLQGAIEKLEANPKLTGNVTARIPLLGSDMAQDSLNPEAAKVRDDIRAAIQGTLRQVLGPQFTEKEGEAIFSRAFNPRMDSVENARRARVELEALQRMIGNKDEAMRYFAQKGTLTGFTPGGTLVADSGIRGPRDGRGRDQGGAIPSAYAAPPPKGMIRMKGPDGKVRLIPESRKGEAIAAGGEVVK